MGICECVGEDLFLIGLREISKEVKDAPSYANNEDDIDKTLGCTWFDISQERKFEVALLGLRRVYEASQNGRWVARHVRGAFFVGDILG